MQRQPTCKMRMSAYFIECNIRGLTTRLDVRVFAVIHFLKAHKDSYAFNVRLTYGGYMAHMESKFKDWRKCSILSKKDGLWGFDNTWHECHKFTVDVNKFFKAENELMVSLQRPRKSKIITTPRNLMLLNLPITSCGGSGIPRVFLKGNIQPSWPMSWQPND